MPESEEIKPTKKSRTHFWLNVGVFSTGFAVIALVLASSLVSGRLFKMNSHLMSALSQSQDELNHLQDTVQQLQGQLNHQADEVDQLKKFTSAINTTPQTVATETYLRLSTISSQIEKIPLQARPVTSVASTKTIADASLPWWKRMLFSMGQALQRIIIIRPLPLSSPPFITTDQQGLFYQNVHAELENAKWALLHHEPQIYQASLAQVTGWIKQYAEPDKGMTQEVLNELAGVKEL